MLLYIFMLLIYNAATFYILLRPAGVLSYDPGFILTHRKNTTRLKAFKGVLIAYPYIILIIAIKQHHAPARRVKTVYTTDISYQTKQKTVPKTAGKFTASTC